MKEYLNKAVRIKDPVSVKFVGIYYDFIGRDFGPYPTKHYAETVGTESSKKEEKLLRMRK